MKLAQTTRLWIFAWLFASLVLLAGGATAATTTYINDFAGWSAAASDFTTIDFETMPDGTASIAGTQINPGFNYTAQGVTFAGTCVGDCGWYDFIIAGNPVSGFSVRSSGDFIDVVTIRADLVQPSLAVAVFFPGGTTLSAYSADDTLIETASYSSGGSGFFIGFVSDEAIAYTIQTRNSSVEDCEAYLFGLIATPVSDSNWSRVKSLYR